MKFKFIGLIIILLVLSVAAVSAADINEIAHTENNASSDGGSTYIEIDETIASFDELQNLIDSNSTIELDKDYSIELGGSTLKISKDLTINGNGYSLNGDGKTRIMEINGNHVTLNNIIFENGKSYRGGAIYNNGNLTVNNCVFQNNTVTDDEGGAIYSDGDLKIQKSIFQNNFANTDDAGAIYSKKSLDISDSKFLYNHAYVDGGAIYCEAGANIVNTLFNFNSANGSSQKCEGGAIRTLGKLTLKGCEFNGNYAENRGGAIEAWGFVKQNTETLTIENCEFNGNVAGGTSTFLGDMGGAISAYRIKFLGEDNSFIGNIGNDGGAIFTKYVDGDIENITFKNNQAGGDGGAIVIAEEYDGKFTHCIFEKNSAKGRGGALFLQSHFSDVTLTHNAFINNSAAFGNSGYTFNNGGIFGGEAFNLGPNWYGSTSQESREGQFYYESLNMDLTSRLEANGKCFEQKAEKYLKSIFDIYSEDENNYAFQEASYGFNHYYDQVYEVLECVIDPFGTMKIANTISDFICSWFL